LTVALLAEVLTTIASGARKQDPQQGKVRDETGLAKGCCTTINAGIHPVWFVADEVHSGRFFLAVAGAGGKTALRPYRQQATTHSH